MGDFVRQMHTTSGLLEEIPHGHTLVDAEAQVLDYLQKFVPDAGVAPLAGNTIGTDRVFLAKEMPLVHSHVHYRNIDVSTIKELSKRWFPKSYFQSPEKMVGTALWPTFWNPSENLSITGGLSLWNPQASPLQN